MPAVRRTGKTTPKTSPRTLRIRVRVSFNGMYAGETAEVPDNRTVRGWIAAHYVEVIDGGQSTARSGGPDQDTAGSEPKRAARGE